MKANPCRRPARFARRHGGTAILEMAIALPVLLYLAMGMVEFDQFFYIKNAFQRAARGACRAAIMSNAQQADPCTAANAALAAAGFTFQCSWMTITDIAPPAWGSASGSGTVTDVSQVPAGHALAVTVQANYGSLSDAVRPHCAISGGVGIPSGRAIAGSCSGLKK